MNMAAHNMRIPPEGLDNAVSGTEPAYSRARNSGQTASGTNSAHIVRNTNSLQFCRFYYYSSATLSRILASLASISRLT